MIQQVQDDPLLLERMMSDLRGCPPDYRPTNFWGHYEKSFLPELRSRGLKSFRRRHESVLASFGAVDTRLRLRLRFIRVFRGAGKLAKILNWFLAEASRRIGLELADAPPLGVARFFYSYVKEKLSKAGFELDRCPTNAWGDPEDLEEVAGGLWSRAHLNYCAMFADAARRIPFKTDSVVCELGSGLGRNAQVIAQLLEGATVLLFDIPPQLYVANQYLKASFGARVVPYNEALQIAPSGAAVPAEARGRILLLPTWKMPEWAGVKIDVFWNSASFQEMEPSVVLNYLKLVERMSPSWIYINATPKGHYQGEWRPGKGGTKSAVTEEHYKDCLEENYKLVEAYDTDYFLTANEMRSYVFEKKR